MNDLFSYKDTGRDIDIIENDLLCEIGHVINRVKDINDELRYAAERQIRELSHDVDELQQTLEEKNSYIEMLLKTIRDDNILINTLNDSCIKAKDNGYTMV